MAEHLCKSMDIESNKTDECSNGIIIPIGLNDNSNGNISCDKSQDIKDNYAANNNKIKIPENCIICLESFKVGDAIVWSNNTSCKHVYHEECMFTWLSCSNNNRENRCPTCRRTFIHMEGSNKKHDEKV